MISGSYLFCSPKVMFSNVTSKYMLCSFRNSIICMQSQNKWFNVSISILQKLHKDELSILHLFKNWLVGIFFKYLYWKSLILISFIVESVVQYMFFQFNSSSKKNSFHFCSDFSLQPLQSLAVYCKQVYLFVEAGQKRLGPEEHLLLQLSFPVIW